MQPHNQLQAMGIKKLITYLFSGCCGFRRNREVGNELERQVNVGLDSEDDAGYETDEEVLENVRLIGALGLVYWRNGMPINRLDVLEDEGYQDEIGNNQGRRYTRGRLFLQLLLGGEDEVDEGAGDDGEEAVGEENVGEVDEDVGDEGQVDHGEEAENDEETLGLEFLFREDNIDRASVRKSLGCFSCFRFWKRY